MKLYIVFGLIFVLALFVGASKESRNPCRHNLPTDERLYCQHRHNIAPDYYAGCFDIYAQLEGIGRAKVVCAGEYEDHEEYIKQQGKKNDL